MVNTSVVTNYLTTLVATCSTRGVSGADIGAESIVASLGHQAAVLSRHTLIDVLTLAPSLQEPSWTRVILPECLRWLTRVAALCVDTHVAVWTRAGVLMTLVDVYTRDQEELISRRTLCCASRL